MGFNFENSCTYQPKQILWVGHYLLVLFVLSVNLALAVPKVILDTDIARVDADGYSASDIDDLSALAILNALANRQECEILCIVTSTRSNTVVGMIDAINTYYHNGEVPIGIKGGNKNLIRDRNSYAKIISKQFTHDQQSIDALDAKSLIRQVLSTTSVSDTIIYIHGDAFANWDYLCIGEFLESESDTFSNLDGWDLFNQKVDEFVSYTPCLPNHQVSNNCPAWADVVSSDTEKVGRFLKKYRNTLTGNTTAPEEVHVETRLWQQQDTHPVKISFEYYYSMTPPPWHQGNQVPDAVSLYGDPLGVFFSIRDRGSTDLLTLETDGSFMLDIEDKLRWGPSSQNHNQQYFFTNPENRIQLNADLDELLNHSPISSHKD